MGLLNAVSDVDESDGIYLLPGLYQGYLQRKFPETMCPARIARGAPGPREEYGPAPAHCGAAVARPVHGGNNRRAEAVRLLAVGLRVGARLAVMPGG
jgi:hypothetical protein